MMICTDCGERTGTHNPGEWISLGRCPPCQAAAADSEDLVNPPHDPDVKPDDVDGDDQRRRPGPPESVWRN